MLAWVWAECEALDVLNQLQVLSHRRGVGALFLPWKATWKMIVLRLGLVLRRHEVVGRRRRAGCFVQEVS
jgi:hypothetical protein